MFLRPIQYPEKDPRPGLHPQVGASPRHSTAASANLNAVRETTDVLLEISRIVNTGLDMETLSICVRLCEQGITPEALSSVTEELWKGTRALKAAGNTS